MPERFKEWTLIKEYKKFGLYTNGLYRTCFDKFDVGLVIRKTIKEVNYEQLYVNES